MGLFSKKQQTCTDFEQAGTQQNTPGARVKILGGGCAKCNQLEAATRAALEQLGMDTSMEHVTDFAKIGSYGVMSTPALVVDDKVLSFGKVLKTEEVVRLLQEIRK